MWYLDFCSMRELLIEVLPDCQDGIAEFLKVNKHNSRPTTVNKQTRKIVIMNKMSEKTELNIRLKIKASYL